LEAHRRGIFHPTVHIWFHTAKGEVLLQQRAGNKDTHPLLWDVSVAGHIGAGEPILLSALREIREEIGLTVSGKDLVKIGVFKSVQKHREDLVDCEFHHTFLGDLKVGLDTLIKQESEVRALALVPLSQFMEELQHPETSQKYVPHEMDYYRTVIKAIQDRL
jgi:isopentenyldiphosphate isomerase